MGDVKESEKDIMMVLLTAASRDIELADWLESSKVGW
jgi:hypothetical protein